MSDLLREKSMSTRDTIQESAAEGAALGRKRRRRGFTLIEIMAVVVIMGMLMGIVGVGVFARVNQARRTSAKAQMSQIESALEFYRMDNSKYPQTLDALVKEPADARNYPRGGYLKKSSALNDPWETPFNYVNPGARNQYGVDLSSAGPDATPGNEDDVNNWEDASAAEDGQ
jgi:general secretion pathway protein G